MYMHHSEPLPMTFKGPEQGFGGVKTAKMGVKIFWESGKTLTKSVASSDVTHL